MGYTVRLDDSMINLNPNPNPEESHTNPPEDKGNKFNFQLVVGISVILSFVLFARFYKSRP